MMFAFVVTFKLKNKTVYKVRTAARTASHAIGQAESFVLDYDPNAEYDFIEVTPAVSHDKILVSA